MIADLLRPFVYVFVDIFAVATVIFAAGLLFHVNPSLTVSVF